MNDTEFFDQAVTVTARISEDGDTTPQSLIWQNKHYSLGVVGRQWDEADGRHVLVEAAGGARFELQLRREDLTWRVRRVWRAPAMA